MAIYSWLVCTGKRFWCIFSIHHISSISRTNILNTHRFGRHSLKVKIQMHRCVLVHQIGLPVAVNQIPQRFNSNPKLLARSVHGQTERSLPSLQQWNHIVQEAVITVGSVGDAFVALRRWSLGFDEIFQHIKIASGLDSGPVIYGFAVQEMSNWLFCNDKFKKETFETHFNVSSVLESLTRGWTSVLPSYQSYRLVGRGVSNPMMQNITKNKTTMGMTSFRMMDLSGTRWTLSRL